jgi:hypothetical protein
MLLLLLLLLLLVLCLLLLLLLLLLLVCVCVFIIIVVMALFLVSPCAFLVLSCVFERWLPSGDLLGLEPYIIWLDLASKTDLEVRKYPVPILAPHELLHALWRAGHPQWYLSMVGPEKEAGLEAFWTNALGQEWGKLHPGLQGCDMAALRQTVPLRVHIDGAESFKNHESVIWSISSPTTKGDTYDTRLPIMSVPDECMHTEELRDSVHREVCRFLGWSFLQCELGVFPAAGFDGESCSPKSLRHKLQGTLIAGGWRAIYAGVKSDAKMRYQTQLFTRYYRFSYCCDACLATIPYKNAPKPLSYGDCSRTALWRDTIISQADYLALEPRVSPWFQIRGHHICLALRDQMHNLYLGVAQDVVASCLWDLQLRGAFGSDSIPMNLKRAYIDYRAWCKLNGVTSTPVGFSLASIGKHQTSDFPCLSSTIKAAHVKGMCFYIAGKTLEHCGNSEHDRMLAVCTYALAQYIHVQDKASFILTPDERNEVGHQGQLFLDSWQWLAGEAQRLRVASFKMRPKLHYICHTIDDAVAGGENPRHQMCFLDEDLMGKVTKLEKSCHRLTVGLRFLQRVMLLFKYRWQRRCASECQQNNMFQLSAMYLPPFALLCYVLPHIQTFRIT